MTLAPLSTSPAPPDTFPVRAGGPPAPTRAQITALLSGIPQSASRLGRASAPVTLTLYGDLECPICRTFVLGRAFATFITRDARAGRVRIVYRGFRTASPSDPVFLLQQVAALAAGEQHRFWQYALLFLQQQGTEGTDYVTDSFLTNIARQVPGLDVTRWLQARRDSELLARARADERSAIRQGVASTPTLFFVGRHGKASFSTAIRSYRQLERTLNRVS